MATIEEPMDPSGRLIAADSVQGASVFDAAGETLGSIGGLMIDKQSGRIVYAILNYGGFLGIGDKRHPLPWPSLRYDQALGGYVVDIDRTTLEGAPAYVPGQPLALDDDAFAREIHAYYGAEPFWAAIV